MSNGIPTLRGGGAAGTALFNQLLQQQGGVGARPNAFMTRRGLDPRTAGSATSLMRLRPPMPQIGLRGIRDISAPTGGGGMTRLQSDLAAKMGLGGKTPTPPKAPPSLMDRLTPAVGTPAFAGLSEAAATGLQLSGYQDKPITTGQGLGAMFGAGMKAFREAKAEETASRRADLADRIAMAKLSQKSDFEKKLALAGIDPSTPEGQKKIQEMLMKSDTNISLGAGKREEIYLKSALEDRKQIRQNTVVEPKVEVRLDQAIALLEGGLKTGALEKGLLPFKKLAAGMGFLGDENVQELSEQEALNAFANQLVPMQRVAGSGSTSDADMQLYKDTIFSLDKTPYANLIIAKTMKQINRHNKQRLALLDKYIEERQTTLGFGDYADSQLPRIFERVDGKNDLQKLYEEGEVNEGDVYYHNGLQKFMFVEFE
jgi:hypothetical protein